MKKFLIEQVSEPKDINDVILQMIANPNLSLINYFNDFNDFNESPIDPSTLDNSEIEELGFWDEDTKEQCMAMTTHAFHHHLNDAPQKATEILTARAVRRMVCYGAKPVAASAMLYHIDYASPQGQFIACQSKKGLKSACNVFEIKITDRKIRFDSFHEHGKLPPTIILSILAKVNDKSAIITSSFKHKGNNIFMIGRPYNDISSSEYLEFYHRIKNSPLPVFDLQVEADIKKALTVLHQKKLIESASPVGKGGLFFSLLRAGMPLGIGFDITSTEEVRKDAFLFGEAMGRIIVGVSPEKQNNFIDLLNAMNVPFLTLGHVTKGEIRIDDVSFGYVDRMYTGN
jgi:phosphoribosylformylglycinamidine (FGAM) synthase-like enzyme